MIFPIMAAVGSLNKIVITGSVYLAAFIYEAASILIQTDMFEEILQKSIVTIIAKTTNVNR